MQFRFLHRRSICSRSFSRKTITICVFIYLFQKILRYNNYLHCITIFKRRKKTRTNWLKTNRKWIKEKKPSITNVNFARNCCAKHLFSVVKHSCIEVCKEWQKYGLNRRVIWNYLITWKQFKDSKCVSY